MKLGDSDMTCWTKFVFINKFIQYVFDLSFTMTMNYSTVWGGGGGAMVHNATKVQLGFLVES